MVFFLEFGAVCSFDGTDGVNCQLNQDAWKRVQVAVFLFFHDDDVPVALPNAKIMAGNFSEKSV